MSGGIQVHGANLTAIGDWLTQLTANVNTSSATPMPNVGSSEVEAAVSQADDWRRGASATVLRDIAQWGLELGDVATVLGVTDQRLSEAAPNITPVTINGQRAV